MKRILLSAMAALTSAAWVMAAEFDYTSAWRDYQTAVEKQQPRTATNVLERIEREALASKRWPDAVRAFVYRAQAEQSFTDEFGEDWIPAFAARVETAPSEVRPYLDLELAHVYAENSERWRWGGSKPTKLTDDAAEAKLPAWAPERLPASLEALFARVLAAADLLKSEPVAKWDGVIARGTMPDSCRPTLYDLAVHDIIDFYGAIVPDKTLEKELKLIDGLIAFHRDDENPDALADAELSRIQCEYAFAELPQKEKDARYDAALDAFVAQYLDSSEVGALALYNRARRLRDGGDSVAARELALSCGERWPKSVGAANCRSLVAEIEVPNVRFETERVWSAPFAPITVRAVNTDKVFFKLAKLDYDDFINDDWQSREKIRSKANRAKPVRSWSVDLPHFDDYAEHESIAAVPDDLAPGYYYLFAGTDDAYSDKGKLYFADKVMVSEIALVTAHGDGRFAGTVFTAKEGARVKDAKVELWGATEWGGKVKRLAKVSTDADGGFSIVDQNWRHCRIRVSAGGSEAVDLRNINAGSESNPSVDPHRISVVTDRAIYRPGQPIKFKGYAAYLDPFTRDFRVLPEARVEVELFDPNDKRVAGFALTANAWGSFIGEFTAPRDRVTGSYRIRSRLLHEKARSETSVSVEEYKRPKFTAEIGRAPADAALGKEIELVGTAKTYSGLPVAGAKVKWSVDRATRYPNWFRWFDIDIGDDDDQVAEGEVETDADGTFRIRFTPVAAPTADLSGEPSFVFSVNADVTDTTGETRSAATSCEIGTVAWRSEVYAAEGQSAGKPFDARVSLASLDGTKTSASGTLTVRRLKEPAAPVRKPLGHDRWNAADARANVPWNWRSWEDGEIVKSLSVEVKDGEWKGALELPAGAYRLVFETKDPSGKGVTGRGEVCVIDYAAEKLGFAAPDYFVLKRPEGRITVGSTVSYLWASGYDRGYGRVELFSNGKLVSRTDTDFAKPFVSGEYTMKEEDRGQFEIRTVFFREGRLYTHRDVVNVAWDNMDLKVEQEHFTSKLTAGAKETWKFKVSGGSEVLAFMYDRSLDAYRSHFVTFPFLDFSVPVKYRPEPATVNFLQDVDPAGGKRPSLAGGRSARWRELADIFTSFAQRRAYGRRERYGGFGGVRCLAKAAVEDCAVMACACAPDACEMESESIDFKEKKRSNASGGVGEPSREPEVAVRKNLEETAFFLPQLETDADGRFTVSFTAPEAMSGWNLQVIAHDRSLRSGELRDNTITTTRPLMVEPNAPRFVREGDDFRFAVKVTNNSDESATATVSLAFENLATLVPAKVGGGEAKVELKPHETKSVEFPVAIPDGQDFLKYTAKAVGAEFADGEEGALAVLSRRIEVREAVQLNVRGKATKIFALTNLIDSVKNGDTIKNVDLSVRVVSRPAWYAVASLPYLMEYPHECCEQTFHRYYANALAGYIANSDPRIKSVFETWRDGAADALKSPLELNADLKAVALEMTPWVREAAGETEAKKRMGILFDEARIASESRRCLAKLEQAITGDDLLPWFPGGPGSGWITLGVLIGSARLERLAGVARPDWFGRVLSGLDRFEKDEVARRLDECKRYNQEFHLSDFDLRWLYLHSFSKVGAGDAETTKLLKSHLEKEWTDFSIGSQALAAVVLHRGGSAAVANEIMKSLKERAVVSEEFGMYYKFGSFFSSCVFAAPVSTQAAVVEAFKEVAHDSETVDALNVWILKQKQTQAWNTTVSTADAVYALLVGGGTDLLAGDELATVTLGGVEVPKKNAEAGTGAYAASWRGADIKPEMGAITLKGVQEKGVVWGGVNWTYLEDVDKVRSFEPKELRIDKQYFRKIRTPQGTRLEPVKGVLEQGDELVARLQIRADRTLEFVHVRDERPSSAEPVDVLSQYRWQDGVGYYQSTRDAATHYYIDRLNKGTFVLETSYRVQQRGVFSGGLAQIQCMYAPEFTAHSTSEKVEVK